MDKFETSRDVLASLTPHEAAVLRRRFSISDTEDSKSDDSAIPPPSGSDDEDGGSGGSAPASPQCN